MRFPSTLLTIAAVSGVVSASSAAEPADPRCPPSIASEHVPVIPDEFAERLRQYQNVREAAFRGWSPQGDGILVATRFGNTLQLHRIRQPGGRREQVTFYDEPVDGRYRPESSVQLLLSTSRGGDENFQIVRHDLDTGKGTLLTDGKSRNLLNAVSADGKSFIVASNRRNGRDMDLLIGDPGQPERLTELMPVENETWSVSDWSTDGKTLLMKRTVSANESYPALFDVASRKRTMIPFSVSRASFGAMKFSPDGKTAFVACDIEGEFQHLFRVDLASFAFDPLSKSIPWDVEAIEVEPKSGHVAFTTNEDGASSLYLLEDNGPRKVDLPLGVVGSLEFSPDGKSLGFSLFKADAPGDAWSLNLADGKLTRWTYSEAGGLDPSQFIVPELVRFPTFDRRQIPAWCYRPRSATKEKPAPVLINIHGGPEGQSRPIFSGVDQFYLNEMGIAVVKPNVRGSEGYGKTYLALDNREKREDSVRDIGALLDWIATQPDLDSRRVAVIGGSYGGYMVLASLVHYSDRLAAGVDIVGIASFESFLKTTSAYRRDLRRVEYGDERDPRMLEHFRKIDPLHRAEKITAALMVAHGRNDPRVPFSEAQQIVGKIRQQGRDVWTVYAANEGHGFAKKDNRDYLTTATALFLKKHLQDSRTPSSRVPTR